MSSRWANEVIVNVTVGPAVLERSRAAVAAVGAGARRLYLKVRSWPGCTLFGDDGRRLGMAERVVLLAGRFDPVYEKRHACSIRGPARACARLHVRYEDSDRIRI